MKEDFANLVLILGIDPGRTGGIAALTFRIAPASPPLAGKLIHATAYRTPWTVDSHFPLRGGVIRRVYRTPADGLLYTLALTTSGGEEETYAYLERPQAAPGMRTSPGSLLKLGESVGLWRMACAAESIPAIDVQPVAWKRYHGLLRSGKPASLSLAKKLFAERTDTPPTKETAEAYLIAAYGASRHELYI